MKVTNIEKMLETIAKSLQEVFPLFDVLQFDKNGYEDQETTKFLVTTLYNGITIKKNDNTLNIVIFDNELYFYKPNASRCCFDFVDFIDLNEIRNQTIFLMRLSVRIERYFQKFKD